MLYQPQVLFVLSISSNQSPSFSFFFKGKPARLAHAPKSQSSHLVLRSLHLLAECVGGASRRVGESGQRLLHRLQIRKYISKNTFKKAFFVCTFSSPKLRQMLHCVKRLLRKILNHCTPRSPGSNSIKNLNQRFVYTMTDYRLHLLNMRNRRPTRD